MLLARSLPDPKGTNTLIEGVCKGVIEESRSGAKGFGYDPIFTPDEHGGPANMSPEEKNAISHRGRAVRNMVNMLT